MVSTLLVISPAARAETLSAWQFDPATQQLTLTLPSGITPHYTVETDPARIVLTLPQTELGAVPAQQTYSGSAVSQISLSQVGGDTVVVLELAANSAIAADGPSLVSVAAEGQTRWILTALAPDSNGTPAAAAPGTADMVVELPIIPGNDPRLGFPEAGAGRLSTSAANLMLPSDIDNLANLPDALPVDPFNLGRPGEQVSVPSLAELDAAVGPVAALPQGASPAQLEPPTSGAAGQPGAIARSPVASPAGGTGSVLTQEPPLTPGTAPAAPEPPTAAPQSEVVAAQPASPAAPPAAQPADLSPIDRDSEASGVPIAVTPPEVTAAAPAAPAAPAAAPAPATPAVTAPDLPAPALPTPSPGAIAVDPPAAPAAESSRPAPVIAENPPALPDLSADAAVPSTVTASPEPGQPADAIAAQPSTIEGGSSISQEPPPVATVPVGLTGTDPNLLTVPAAPTTTSQGTVVPPDEPVIIASAGEPILFGSPLPGGSQAALPSSVNPAPADRPLSPDTLVAAGTVLELQYVGDEPLDLSTNSSQNQVLLLAHDIRDPITNGIVAPAGSQLIGQFEPSLQGQRWVSKMLIAPAGQQVAFASTTDYIVGNTEVSTPRLAAGAGLGALALLLLTGFSGIGLVGGALVGATTVVGTSPQTVVIEPNQVIQVQVIQDIPRAIPIAAAPENSREWGSGGW